MFRPVGLVATQIFASLQARDDVQVRLTFARRGGCCHPAMTRLLDPYRNLTTESGTNPLHACRDARTVLRKYAAASENLLRAAPGSGLTVCAVRPVGISASLRQPAARG